MNGYGTSPLELMACEAMLNGVCYLDEFVYSASWIAGTSTELKSLATVPVQIIINGDSDFINQEENIVAFADNDVIDNPNYLITIVRAGSGREIMNQEQHVLNVAGGFQNGRFPGRKPMPGLINANNVLTLRLQNLTTTVPDRVDYALRGFKVFYTTNNAGQTGDRVSIFHAM